jgi:nitrite reductase/ring-hydroxylating ferredoxin subunit
MATVEAGSAPPRKIPTLDTLSEGQIAAIKAIPPHTQVEVVPLDDRKPVSFFFDEDQYRLEMEKIYRRLPVPIGVSPMLPEPGTAVANDSYGVPVLLMRSRDGEVRAFLNACKHKGSKLITEPGVVQKAPRVVCPYHAWAFGLDGKLLAIPRADTFCNIEKNQHNLTELPCREAGGLIWVILDKNARSDFSMVEDDLSADLGALGLPMAHIYGYKTFDLKANWKLVLEPFLEIYHVQRLHAKSIASQFVDNPTITTQMGAHIRSVSGRADFSPELIGAGNIHKYVTQSYRLFPNGILITSPYYISLMIIMPTSVSTTKVDYYMLTQGPPDNPKAEELYKRSYGLILEVFGKEDFWAAEMAQAGLSSGALEEVRYCGLEDKIPLYYQVLDKYLAA